MSRQKPSFVATKVCSPGQTFCRDKLTFVATKHVFCREKHNFVATKLLFRRAYFCRDKIRVFYVFVATKIMLVAASANDKRGRGTAVKNCNKMA